MFSKKALATLGASALLALLHAAPAVSEDIPEMQQENIEGSGPDVDPGASRGKDAPIPQQEEQNIEGSGPNVDPDASRGADPSIPSQENKDLQ